jgi:hypothetical protein
LDAVRLTDFEVHASVRARYWAVEECEDCNTPGYFTQYTVTGDEPVQLCPETPETVATTP